MKILEYLAKAVGYILAGIFVVALFGLFVLFWAIVYLLLASFLGGFIGLDQVCLFKSAVEFTKMFAIDLGVVFVLLVFAVINGKVRKS